MDRRRVLAAACALVVSAVLAACDVQVGQDGGFSFDVASGRAQDTWSRSYTVADRGRLELININGRITAEPASGSQVELVAERVARASSDESAKEMLGKVDMREEVGDSRVRVEVRAPRQFQLGGVEVRWTVKVPKGVVVDLRNSNGKVQINGLSGEVHARTVNGGIEGRDLAVSALEASTVNGGVDVDIVEPIGDGATVDLESVNGGVALALAGASRARILARVTNGGISTGDLALEPTGEQTRRRVEGTLNGGGASVTLETTNGGVRVTRSRGRSTSTS
jgi:hypothetical protein